MAPPPWSGGIVEGREGGGAGREDRPELDETLGRGNGGGIDRAGRSVASAGVASADTGGTDARTTGASAESFPWAGGPLPRTCCSNSCLPFARAADRFGVARLSCAFGRTLDPVNSFFGIPFFPTRGGDLQSHSHVVRVTGECRWNANQRPAHSISLALGSPPVDRSLAVPNLATPRNPAPFLECCEEKSRNRDPCATGFSGTARCVFDGVSPRCPITILLEIKRRWRAKVPAQTRWNT